MQYLLLFLEGIITFISPCMLPMIPIYLTYFAVGRGGKETVLRRSFAFVMGFTLVFVTLGAFAGTLGRLLVQYQTVVNLVMGGVVILFGLNYLGVLRVPLLNRQTGPDVGVREMNVFSAFLFGTVFAVAWTPCVGAFLGSALMLASLSGSTLQGMLMLLVFSLGLSLPFMLSALLVDQLKGAFDFIKRHYKVVNAVSGVLLIVIGILMATGHLGRLLAILSV